MHKRVPKYLRLPLYYAVIIVVIEIILYTGWGKERFNMSSRWEDWLKIILWISSLALSLYSLHRSETRCEKNEVLKKAEKLLIAAVKRLFPNENLDSIRANLMVVDGKKGNKNLRIFASWNMDAYPDKDIQLSCGQGCAGVAWKRACTKGVRERWLPVVALSGFSSSGDLRTKWRLSDEQIDKTKHVSWVLSVPVFIKDKNGHTQLGGVLNFDGVQDLKDPEYLKLEQTHSDAVDIAAILGKEIEENLYHFGDLCAKKVFICEV